MTFPVRSLDMSPYVEPDKDRGGGEPIWYDLVGNVTHEAVRKRDDTVGAEEEGSEGRVWRAQLRGGEGGWTEIQDLWVQSVRAEMVCLGESYLQVWERRKTPKGQKH